VSESAISVRVGQGFDIHRFSDDPGRVLVLGGVTFPGERGLAGHSDADAVAHAVADAMLGAAGLGDIGQHFPDTDDRWRGVDSLVLLAAVRRLLDEAGWRVANVDCSVVCEVPKIAPRRSEMERRLSDAAGGPVSVKGRRAEGLGAIGRSEGVACWANALIVRSSTPPPASPPASPPTSPPASPRSVEADDDQGGPP
jgi:2-C-methyl-D-erythritol 2,4-cyclodiphosphate synthase